MGSCASATGQANRMRERMERASAACMVRCLQLLSLLLIGVSLPLGVAAEQALTAEQSSFFEAKIRPVLAEQCYQCHSAEAKGNKKLKGGLFLDSRSGLLTGGDTGPAIMAGKPDQSLLMTAIRWQDPDLQMPPKSRLADAVVGDFAAWIAMGAPDPRSGPAAPAKPGIDLAKGRAFWAFTPLHLTAPPQVKQADWVKTPIDRFILARQEAAGILPSAPIGREKFIRRASYAVTGLPPTPAAVAAYVADPGYDADVRMIDRLLADPAYGECWGRHWLDVVRYAESGGYEFDGYRASAYHYRDWVIRALNADLPYDEFIRAQIAGDKLKPADYDSACATGFLVAGPYPGQITAKTKERIRYDQLDDMVATIGSSMLGLTIGCARCHDHKFDPLPQRDYYALAAALARTEQAEIKVNREAADMKRRVQEHELGERALREALSTFAEGEFPKRFAAWQKTDLPRLASTTPWQAIEPLSAEAHNAILEVTADGRVRNIANREKRDLYTVKAFTGQRGLIGFRIDVFAGDDLPGHGPGLSSNGNFVLTDLKIIARPHDPALKAKPITLKLKAGAATFEQKDYPLSATLDNSPDSGWGVFPQTGKDHAATFAIDGNAFGFPGGTELEFQISFDYFAVGILRLSLAVDAHQAKAAAPDAALAIPALSDAVEAQDLREIQAELNRDGGQLPPAERDLQLRWFTRFDQTAAQLVEALRDHQRHMPRPETMTVYSTTTGGQDVYLLRRGEVDNKDIKSDPGFLQVLEDGSASRWQRTEDGDPRLGLCRWITDPDNGAGRLLARVMVNRLWKYQFGRGLVATPNDFGLQGERPSDPELLDYLAGELIRNGWRLKPLQRQLMLSAVYRQGADESGSNRARDPDNKLWWQRPALRLEAEAIRDSLLAVGGMLERTMFGPALEDIVAPRRSVYLRVRRSELFPFLTLFDAPEPSQSNGDRGATTQPTQALALMNSPFIHRAADNLGKIAMTPGTSLPDAIARAFHLALSRAPTADEVAKLTIFFAQQQTLIRGSQPATEVDGRAMARLCLVVLSLNEFIYVD
jgi:hypothetical protein